MRERVIARVISPYLANLYGCCYATHHRTHAPRALKNSDMYRPAPDRMFDELRQLTTLKGQTELFQSHIDQGAFEQSDFRIHRQLCDLIVDVKDLLSFSCADNASSASHKLEELIQAQVDEAKEAKKTSAKLGLLSQLAYFFLPLQVTVSALGMNLQALGTGNVQLRSFFLVLAFLAIVSFVPMLSPILSGKRISDIGEISRHSRRLAFLFGWFCLCHGSITNDKLSNCGTGYDLKILSGRYNLRRRIVGDQTFWRNGRTQFIAALQSQPFLFLPRYWKKVVEEIFDIIDKPNWGRDEEHLHRA